MYANLLFCRSEPARDGLENTAGCQTPRVIGDDHREHAPTGALANEVDLAGIVVADVNTVDPGLPHFDIAR